MTMSTYSGAGVTLIALSLLCSLSCTHARIPHVEHVRTSPSGRAYANSRVPMGRTGSAPPRTFGGAISQGNYGVTETEVFSHTVTDWSVMSHFWITGEGKITDALIRYYIDGETTASIQMEPGYACGIGLADKQGAPFGIPGMGKGANQGGFYHDHKIPFQSSVRITISIPQVAIPAGKNTTTVYLIFRGVENMTPVIGGFNLGPSKLTLHKLLFQKLQPLEYITLLDIPAGPNDSGLIYMTTLAIQSGNLNYLEGCFRMYTPANVSYPGTLLSSGTEDYFNSAYYFDAGRYYLPDAGLTHLVTNSTSKLGPIEWSAYKMHTNDPLYFQGGIKYIWRNGDAYDPGTGLKCTVQTGGTTVGSPTESYLISYVWTYTWES